MLPTFFQIPTARTQTLSSSYSLSIFNPTRFSSSNMASSSSVKLANILPMSLSTLTDTVLPEVGMTLVTTPAAEAASVSPTPLGVCKSTVVVMIAPPPTADEHALVAHEEATSPPVVGGYCKVGERKCKRPTVAALPPLPPLVLLPMLSLRISEASCSDDEDLSEWNEWAILAAIVFVEDDEDDDEEDSKCVVCCCCC